MPPRLRRRARGGMDYWPGFVDALSTMLLAFVFLVTVFMVAQFFLSRDVTGKDAATVLDKAQITVNKNAIPFDTQSPFVTSGIRVGTPAVTTRGMKEPEMLQIADFITKILRHAQDDQAVSRVREEVLAFTAKFPVP